jgi:catechol 2,3-dioxygenase-like lactoylglutathione lyase family enzyme
MASAIDHLVIAVPDPDAAAQKLEAELGLAATGGGEHPGVGTYNRLVFLGDAYLELIGIADEAAATRWPVGAAALRALTDGGGFATFALVDDELEATAARLRGSGSAIGHVSPGSRTRPDGERVEWWTATFAELGPDRPPFLIRHAYTGAEWGDEALQRRRAFVHPIGTPVALAGLGLATGNAAGLAQTYERELGMSFVSGPNGVALGIGPHRVRLLPRGAPHVVHLTGPVAASADLFGMRFEFGAQP